VLDGGLVNPLTEFKKVKGEALTGLEAFRSGLLVLVFESDRIFLEWNDADQRVLRPS